MTKLLLDDQLAPITSEYGFVEASVEKLARWFCEWQSTLMAPRGIAVHMRTAQGSLRNALALLAPLTIVERKRFLFLETRSPWVAYFDNGARGTDAGVLSHVALELHCRAVRLVSIPDTLGRSPRREATGRFGGSVFTLYGPSPTPGGFMNQLRSISAINDGGKWSFAQSGKPLEGEDLAAMGNRSIAKRFGPEQLNRCLQSLGIHAFTEDFYTGRSFLVERRGTFAPGVLEYSLDEARALVGT